MLLAELLAGGTTYIPSGTRVLEDTADDPARRRIFVSGKFNHILTLDRKCLRELSDRAYATPHRNCRVEKLRMRLSSDLSQFADSDLDSLDASSVGRSPEKDYLVVSEFDRPFGCFVLDPEEEAEQEGTSDHDFSTKTGKIVVPSLQFPEEHFRMSFNATVWGLAIPPDALSQKYFGPLGDDDPHPLVDDFGDGPTLGIAASQDHLVAFNARNGLIMSHRDRATGTFHGFRHLVWAKGAGGSGEVLRVFVGSGNRILELGLSQLIRGPVASQGGAARRAYLRRWRQGRRSQMVGHEKSVWGLAMWQNTSKEGDVVAGAGEEWLVSCSVDGTAAVWDVSSSRSQGQEGSKLMSASLLDFGCSVACLPEQHMFCVGVARGVVQVWDVRNLGRMVHFFRPHMRDQVTSIRRMSKETFVSVCIDQTVAAWKPDGRIVGMATASDYCYGVSCDLDTGEVMEDASAVTDELRISIVEPFFDLKVELEAGYKVLSMFRSLLGGE